MGEVLARVDFTQPRSVEEILEENRILKEMVTRHITPSDHKPKPKPVEDIEYNPLRSDGIKKATAAQTIPDYDTFVSISECLLDDATAPEAIRARNYALFWCGIGLGLRFSDVVRIQPKFIWDENGNYRERLTINEKKTRKFNQCLITEAVRKALDFYVTITKGGCKRGKYLFPSSHNGGREPLTTVQGWRIFAKVQKKLELPFHFSTHSLRHTCLNVCLCIDDHVIDPMVLMKLQVMANHTNLTTTIGYLDSLWGITDQARKVVSDWMLGKTEKKVLTM